MILTYVYVHSDETRHMCAYTSNTLITIITIIIVIDMFNVA